MEEQWHLVRNGSQSGPHSFSELQRLLGGMDPVKDQILVWTERLAEWTDPRQVPGLLTAAEPEISPEPASSFGPGPAAVSVPMRSGGGPAAADLAALNPYETPASTLVQARTAPPAAQLGSHELDVGACLRSGWKLTTSQFWKLILFGLAYIGLLIVAMIPLGLVQSAFGPGEDGSTQSLTAGLVTLVVQLLQNGISIFLGIGATLFGLGVVRRTNPSLSMLFAGGTHFWSVVLASILVGLSVIAGFLLLILPGIYIAVRLSQFQFAIVDQKLGPLDGLRASWAITKGNFWNLFLLGLATFGIVILGALALGVGLFWAYPTVILAAVAAYVCMSSGVGSLPRWE